MKYKEWIEVDHVFEIDVGGAPLTITARFVFLYQQPAPPVTYKDGSGCPGSGPTAELVSIFVTAASSGDDWELQRRQAPELFDWIGNQLKNAADTDEIESIFLEQYND